MKKNPGRPKIKGARRPYVSPPRNSQVDKSIRAYTKRLRQGKA